MNSLEKAIWNWMDTYPNEFAEVQKQEVRKREVQKQEVQRQEVQRQEMQKQEVPKQEKQESQRQEMPKQEAQKQEPQKQEDPNEDLGKACEELFHLLDMFVDNKKSRAAMTVWPLQIMLLVLSPKVLEEIMRSDKGTGSPRHIKKKHFIDNIKRGLGMYGSSSSRQLTEAAAVTCVKLTKAATYISNQHSNNVVLTLVQQLMADLVSLLFSTSKPFSRGQNYTTQDVDLIIDCFVSCFRINPHNSEVLKVCLNVNYPSTYQLVLVSSLYKQVPKNIFFSQGSRRDPGPGRILIGIRCTPFRIITQPRLSWWPQIDLLYPHSTKLRNMFTDTLNKVTQNYISYTPLRIHLNLLKSKEDIANSKNVLLGLVRLIHADPMLMLHVCCPYK